MHDNSYTKGPTISELTGDAGESFAALFGLELMALLDYISTRCMAQEWPTPVGFWLACLGPFAITTHPLCFFPSHNLSLNHFGITVIGPGAVRDAEEPGMTKTISRRQFLPLTLLGLLPFGATGCGTVIHPERKGQPAGPLDWEIVALDAIGLLFFFVPGVIAFAVDFNNGTIYVPAEERPARAASKQAGVRKLIPIPTPRWRLTPAAIEEAVVEQSGVAVRLIPGAYQTKELESLEQFWATRDEFDVG